MSVATVAGLSASAAYHATIFALHLTIMPTESPRPAGAQPHIAGGRTVVVAIVCWCLGWMLGLGALISQGALSNGLSLVARVLLWASFGCIVVAILVRLVSALRKDSNE